MGFTKITEDMAYELAFNEISEKLDGKSQEMLNELLDSYKSDLIYSIVGCESPIESILALAMQQANLIDTGNWMGMDIVGIHNQEVVETKDRKYRVDFLIPVCYMKHRRNKTFIIECNGHEYHNKTKAQVKRDNERQRALSQEGYTVLNFSGSEIYNEPYKCVREIRDAILAQYTQYDKELGFI